MPETSILDRLASADDPEATALDFAVHLVASLYADMTSDSAPISPANQEPGDYAYSPLVLSASVAVAHAIGAMLRACQATDVPVPKLLEAFRYTFGGIQLIAALAHDDEPVA